MDATPQAHDDEYAGTCPRCGSERWVAASFNGGSTRVPQCVPCGATHSVHLLGCRPPTMGVALTSGKAGDVVTVDLETPAQAAERILRESE